MVMYAKIRRMFFREHLTISEIQRRSSLSRNTIKKGYVTVKYGIFHRYLRSDSLYKIPLGEHHEQRRIHEINQHPW
jgi:hypothetical protein